jgi:hypothetical protein
MNLGDIAIWSSDWVWSLPLIVLTVVMHVIGLGFIIERVIGVADRAAEHRRFMPMFVTVMCVTAALATLLHGIEAATWGLAYRLLGALPDNRTAMLYSLSAITSYGHAELFLENKWKLMGALEALNGMLLFGLTTAFLFAMIQQVWPLGSGAGRRR